MAGNVYSGQLWSNGNVYSGQAVVAIFTVDRQHWQYLQLTDCSGSVYSGQTSSQQWQCLQWTDIQQQYLQWRDSNGNVYSGQTSSSDSVYSGQTSSSDNVYSGQTSSNDSVYSGQTCSQQRPVAAAAGCRSQFVMQVAMAADKQHQHKQPVPCLPPTETVAL